MEEKKYTKGTWYTMDGDDGSLDVKCVNKDNKRVHIAYVNHPDNEANANLIAAAPDILEALELYMQVASVPSDIYKQAKKAINKALG